MEGKTLTDKKLCRRAYIKERAQLLHDYKKLADKKICDSVLELDLFKEAENIFIYAANEAEVSTELIAIRALELSKNIFYPRVTSEGCMSFFQVKDIENDLKEGYKGIYEPKSFCREAFEKPDIIIVPGVAFDRSFHRMGYGKGFYDRFFYEKKFDAVRLALCHANMLKDEIPSEAHDELMDMIITEEEIWKRKNYSWNT